MSYVVVPAAAGPCSGPGVQAPDDVDTLVEELFGVDDRGPNRWDAAMVLGGLALLVWFAALSGPSIAGIGGAVVLGLGLILPLREIARRAGSAREARHGIKLSLLPVEARELLAAVDAARAASVRFGRAVQDEVLQESHVALQEVATLAGGRSEWTPAERAYASERATALGRLCEAMEAAPDVVEPAVSAVRELELSAGSSVDRIDSLRATLGRGSDG